MLPFEKKTMVTMLFLLFIIMPISIEALPPKRSPPKRLPPPKSSPPSPPPKRSPPSPPPKSSPPPLPPKRSPPSPPPKSSPPPLPPKRSPPPLPPKRSPPPLPPKSSPPSPPPKSSPPSPPSSPPPSPPTPFDFFLLALTWPASFCQINTCGNGAASAFPKFTLHGLWPSNYSASQPRLCTPYKAPNWSDPKLKQLMTSLTSSWPDLKQYSSTAKSYTSFWNDQWEKHGNCSTMEHYEYFSAAEKLLSNKDLLAILQSGGIQAGVNPISYKTVVSTISTGIGKSPRITCKTSTNKKSYIVEIGLCLDKTKVIQGNMQDVYNNCPLPLTTTCPATVYLA